MFPYFLFALVAFYTVNGRVIPRATPPPGWDTQCLEPYDTFNCRYLALQCGYKYNTNFYSSCCYPLSVNETISSLPTDCQMPSNTTCVNGSPVPANASNITSSAPTISPSPVNLAPLPTTTDTNDACGESTPSTNSMTPGPTFTSSPVVFAPSPTTTNPDDGCGDGPSSTPTVSAAPSPTTTGDDDCGETSTPSPTLATSSPVVLAPLPTTTNTDDGCGDETSSAPSTTPTSSSTPLPTPTSPSTPSPSPTTSLTPSAAPTTTAAPINVAPAPTPESSPTPTTSSLTPAQPSSTASSSDSSSGPFTGGVATYFYQDGNPGACGQVHQDTDFICAMDQARYGDSGNSSPLCGQQVQITNLNNGQTVTVTIADDCPTCENANSIDLSVAAFQAISDLSVGEVPISWVFLN